MVRRCFDPRLHDLNRLRLHETVTADGQPAKSPTLYKLYAKYHIKVGAQSLTRPVNHEHDMELAGLGRKRVDLFIWAGLGLR